MYFVPHGELRKVKTDCFFFQIPLRWFTERRDFLFKNRVLDMVCRMCLSQFWTSKKNSFTGKGRGLNERPPRNLWKGKSRWPQLGKTFMLDLFFVLNQMLYILPKPKYINADLQDGAPAFIYRHRQLVITLFFILFFAAKNYYSTYQSLQGWLVNMQEFTWKG